MNKQRSQAALSRVIVTFLKSMVGSYILYTPKVPLRSILSCYSNTPIWFRLN